MTDTLSWADRETSSARQVRVLRQSDDEGRCGTQVSTPRMPVSTSLHWKALQSLWWSPVQKAADECAVDLGPR